MAMRKNAAPVPPTPPAPAPGYSRPITASGEVWVKGPAGWVNEKNGTPAGVSLVPALDAELAKIP
jgi:hypothetical protein